jgi:hypothetical protein
MSMGVLRFLTQGLALVVSALVGNWVGEQFRVQTTGQRGHQLRFSYTNTQGDIVIAANPLVTNLGPALLFAFMGRPRWMYAFLGGVLASALLDDRYEDRFWELIRGIEPGRMVSGSRRPTSLAGESMGI